MDQSTEQLFSGRIELVSPSVPLTKIIQATRFF
jgi:hypothetical protein